jgi:hypothetical protein
MTIHVHNAAELKNVMRMQTPATENARPARVRVLIPIQMFVEVAAVQQTAIYAKVLAFVFMARIRNGRMNSAAG